MPVRNPFAPPPPGPQAEREPEPALCAEGALMLDWLRDRLATNASLAEYEGPFGHTPDAEPSPERRVRLARYLASHGEAFVPVRLPEGIDGGTPGACFCNSAEFVADSWRYRKALAPALPEGAGCWDAQYAEGVCFNRKAPVLHAWNAFPGSQRVYDTTYGINAPGGDPWVWEDPARFHHYGEPDNMAYVGVRVPREVVFACIVLAQAQDRGFPSILALPGVIEALEREPERPGLALARAVGDLVEDEVERMAGKRGVGPLRTALKNLDRLIARAEPPRGARAVH
jgi:hypothetical protein